MADLAQVLEDLSSKALHIREQALRQLEEATASAEDVTDDLCNGVIGLLEAEPWESRQGGLLASKVLLIKNKNPAFRQKVLKLSLENLEDDEPRVRLAAAESCGALAARMGLSDFQAMLQRVMQSIDENLDQSLEISDRSINGYDSGDEAVPPKLSPRGSNTSITPKRSRHAGKLETSLQTLRCMIKGCGPPCFELIKAEACEKLLQATSHRNRYVREAGFFALGALSGIASEENLKEIGSEVSSSLAHGLADSWSQVRYAASVATRAFMRSAEGHPEQYYAAMLPPMCLNRYYHAEGLRLYSQETWKEVMGTNGREYIANHIDSVVSFYVSQCQANNAEVREAACFCAAELATKIAPEKVALHVVTILKAISNCFKDDTWQVRDAACSASSRCFEAFPQEARPLLDQYLDLWILHLSENMPRLRENSAAALAVAAKVYKDEVLNKMLQKLQELLASAPAQQRESPHHCCGAQHRQAAAQEHNQGGSSSLGGGFQRPCEAWEASEGGVYLMRELSAVYPAECAKLLPQLAQLGACTEGFHFHHLLETLYLELPVIAKNVGKRPFKAYLELFLEPLFWALGCGQVHAQHAAGKAITELQAFIGPNIFRGRLDEHQQAALDSSPFLGSRAANVVYTPAVTRIKIS